MLSDPGFLAQPDQTSETGWQLVRSAAALTEQLADADRPVGFGLTTAGFLERRSLPFAELAWHPATGWRSLLERDDARNDMLDLYLPIAGAHAGRPIVIGHLGQSLDGFIATATGDSCFVTGPANFLHLHRLRTLCDAVVVGARTVSTDNPRLTTRLVAGASPTRVILDPHRRLDGSQRLFNDAAAPTVRVSLASCETAPIPRENDPQELCVGGTGAQLDLVDLLRQLHARGCHRILVEGGGVTVARFLQAGVLDRLHVAIAPVLIGAGRPALALPEAATMNDCLRLTPRVFLMGEDTLFDCPLDHQPQGREAPELRRVR